MFNRYPYTNFHELNLDYFIQHFKEIFTECEQLYNELQSWKTDTTEELEQWRAEVETNLDEREAALRAKLEIWKQDTADDISEWEAATLNALDAWKTAATVQFEAIRVQAAASAEAAAAAQTAAETARTQAQTAQAAAETAAQSVQASAAQIQQNVDNIDDLKTQLNGLADIVEHNIFENDFQIGAYSQTGIVSNTSRAYNIYTGVNKGSKIYFDSSRFSINYYYIVSESDFTNRYSPNVWDESGEITLDYDDNATVFVAVRAGVTSLTSRLEEINRAVHVFNNFTDDANYITYNGPITGTTLAENNEIGFYSIGGFSTQQVQNLTDMPVTDFAGGWLLNTYVGSAGTIIKQTLIENDSGTITGRRFKKVTGSSWHGIGYVNWVAFGDSITHGSYSTSNGETLNEYRHSYAYRIAKNLRHDTIYNFYNCAVRGIGWVNTGNNGETFSDMMDLFTGDKTSINLVTIMLGINDYISLEVLGTENSAENDGTISGAIRYGLRYLCENYPNAKIIAISPLNSKNHGNANNGWSRNTRLTNPGTLQDICDMIKYWCNVYNVTYINEISESFLNNYNISNFLGDKLHPTNNGQWMLARELARKIDI